MQQTHERKAQLVLCINQWNFCEELGDEREFDPLLG